jgi:GDSL-like Lipase/Acylhydrolase family
MVLAILVALVVAASAAGAPSGSNATPFKYVALGDSFSAGEGVYPYFKDGVNPSTGAQAPNACDRASRAYSAWVKRPGDAAPLYAIASGSGKPGILGGMNKYGSDKNVRSSGGVGWASWACSGAKTKNVLPQSLGGAPQVAAGQIHDRQTQLDSADLAGADLVTLTIGGNDVGFVDGLITCAVSNCNTQAFEQGRIARMDRTKPLLEALYKEIARRAPKARVLVLGYPQLFPATKAEQSCSGLTLFSGEQNMLRRLGVRLNSTIAAAVGSVATTGAKIEFVPVTGRFSGHEACGRKGTWVSGIFHPSLQGHRDGYAAAVNAALSKPAR